MSPRDLGAWELGSLGAKILVRLQFEVCLKMNVSLSPDNRLDEGSSHERLCSLYMYIQNTEGWVLLFFVFCFLFFVCLFLF